ncbi:heme-degrading domain-containing protein [Celerinatantimonas yamalensis]|uniref:Heme-binding protein n=1 Tax=Celerinatantimonas yamalensis TaxID=559956 RepID=A0ABW9GCM9_9GAMM
MLRTIQLEEFSNEIALEMGLKVIEEARSTGKKIAVSVDRLNHNIFKFVSENLPADKHDWLRRKANVAIRFEESSLAVKNDLESGGMSLKKTFGLESNDYIAKGGSIPIKVRNAGLVAVITVSGLSDVEDHDLIVSALRDYI